METRTQRLSDTPYADTHGGGTHGADVNGAGTDGADLQVGAPASSGRMTGTRWSAIALIVPLLLGVAAAVGTGQLVWLEGRDRAFRERLALQHARAAAAGAALRAARPTGRSGPGMPSGDGRGLTLDAAALAALRARVLGVEATLRGGAGEARALEVPRGWLQRWRDRPAGAEPLTGELVELWNAAADAAGALRDFDSGLASLVAQGDKLRVKLNAMTVNADELVQRVLVADSSLPQSQRLNQVHVATRQLALIERIQRSILKLEKGGAVALAAADRAGRDAVLLGDVNNALLVGNRRMHIERVDDPEARSYLELIGRDFRALAVEMEALFERAGALKQAPGVASVAASKLEGVERHLAELERRHRESRRARVLGWPAVWALAAAAVLGALALSLLLWREARRVESGERGRREQLRLAAAESQSLRDELDQAEERAAQEKQAMAAIVWRLADDEVAAVSPAVDDGHTDAYFRRAVETLASRLNAGAGELCQASAKLSGATGLLAEAAGSLEAVSGDAARGMRAARTAGDVLGEGVRALAAEAQTLGEAAREGGDALQRGRQQVDELAQHVSDSAGAVAEVHRAVRGALDASAGIKELLGGADELSDRARMLALNLSLRADGPAGGAAAEQGAEEIARLAEQALGLGRLADAVREAIETDGQSALRASRRASLALERAQARSGHAREAVASAVAGTRSAQSLAERFAAACREQQAELRRHVHALAELAVRSEEGRSGATRVSAAAGRLRELSGALQRRAERLLPGARAGATVVQVGDAGDGEPRLAPQRARASIAHLRARVADRAPGPRVERDGTAGRAPEAPLDDAGPQERGGRDPGAEPGPRRGPAPDSGRGADRAGERTDSDDRHENEGAVVLEGLADGDRGRSRARRDEPR